MPRAVARDSIAWPVLMLGRWKKFLPLILQNRFLPHRPRSIAFYLCVFLSWWRASPRAGLASSFPLCGQLSHNCRLGKVGACVGPPGNFPLLNMSTNLFARINRYHRTSMPATANDFLFSPFAVLFLPMLATNANILMLYFTRLLLSNAPPDSVFCDFVRDEKCRRRPQTC